MKIILFLLTGILLAVNISVAQNSIKKDEPIAHEKYPKPKVILFMLHLSTNKIEGLKKRGMGEYIPAVIKDDALANSSIMKAFAENFNFCPVYFFYDTCYEKAKNKQWNEITFYDYESLTMKKKIGTNSFSDYYFAEVGYPSPGEQLIIDSTLSESRIDRLQGDEDAVASRNNGINVYDENFKPIRGKFGFIDAAFLKKGKLFGPKELVFIGASKFNRNLRTRYNSTEVEQ